MSTSDTRAGEVAEKSDQASHKKKVDEGKQDREGETDKGHTAEDSTGINADDRKPIDPKMPNLPPA